MPTTSVAVSDSVSLTAAVMLVANDPSPAEVEVAVACETVSTTLMVSPLPATAPGAPCTRDVPLLGGSAKIRLALGAAGGVCLTVMVTVEEAESLAKSVAVAVMMAFAAHEAAVTAFPAMMVFAQVFEKTHFYS